MEIFRTLVPVSPSNLKLHHGTQIMFSGSCFSEYIGNKLIESKFRLDNNPFGIVFNPLSIANQLERLMDGTAYTTADLISNQGVWCSFDHHSKFSDVDQETCLKNINSRLESSGSAFKAADILFLTFGTSFVYHVKATEQLVSNCHKVPEKEFERKMACIEDIVSTYNKLIIKLQEFNPKLHIVFTVSPIRHWKDGAHQNQLSKSTLLLAINQINKKHPNTSYFPSYELVLDDLRDYRFYAEDMLHPNTLAINYIWSRFKECFMEPDTILLMREVEKVIQASKHKPFNPKTEAFQSFARQFYEKIQYLKKQYSISLETEELYFKSFLPEGN